MITITVKIFADNDENIHLSVTSKATDGVCLPAEQMLADIIGEAIAEETAKCGEHTDFNLN